MIKKFSILISLLLLTACASTQPISGCPKVDVQPEPRYAIQDLTAQSGRADVSKAWVASFYQCRGALDRCNRTVEGTQ